jgi:hypothetical protein
MSVFQHINAWQALFSATIPLLVLAFIQIAGSSNVLARTKENDSSPPHRRTSSLSSFVPTLTEAFSSGTLHSKIYA